MVMLFAAPKKFCRGRPGAGGRVPSSVAPARHWEVARTNGAEHLSDRLRTVAPPQSPALVCRRPRKTAAIAHLSIILTRPFTSQSKW